MSRHIRPKPGLALAQLVLAQTARTSALALPLLGCVDNQLHPTVEGSGRQDRADIAVTPKRLDFGALGHGETATRTFTVTNAGTESSVLEVKDITIEGAVKFALVEPFAEFRLIPGDARTFSVGFTPPDSNADEALVSISSDDDDESRVEIPLVGTGIYPELTITPDELELGQVTTGCLVDHTLTLTNTGNDLLLVSSLTHEGPGFTLPSPPSLPARLAPGDNLETTIRFLPIAPGDHAGTVRSQSDDPAGERVAVQHAVAHDPAHLSDAFDLPGLQPVDILFYVDQSASMRDDQAALIDNFDAYITALADITSNWHLLVANKDSGCSISGVLTRDMPGYAADFAGDATQGGGKLTEAGLFVSANAAEESMPGGCNEGFLRRDALLHVVLVSDEADQSPEPWSTYVDRIRAVKGNDDRRLRISAVAGDWPVGCTTADNTAEAGTGYHEAVQATGGVFLSLCSDWAAHVVTLAEVGEPEPPTFPLSSTPDPGTLVVRVDGEIHTGDWAWNPERNEIVFLPTAMPAAGSHVQVDYTAPFTCP